MEKTSNYFAILISLLLLSSCGSEKSEQEILDDLGDRVERESRENFDLLLTARQEDTLRNLTLEDKVSNDFAVAVCQASWAKSNLGSLAFVKWKELLENSCTNGKIITRTFPTMITQHGDKTILWHFYDKDNKSVVQDFSILSNEKIAVKRSLVKTRDEINLSVYEFNLNKNDRFNLYIRSASFQNDPIVYSEIIKLALSNSMNVIFEEVRGSRNSGGQLRWFDNKSIEDAEDVVKWIKEKTTKPIVAFGQGYDAMMSLAVGMGKEKVQSIISCSAPIGLSNLTGQGYSYDKLKFIWESENGHKFDQMFEKTTFIRSQGLGKKRIDLLLFGREIRDYRDYLTSQGNYKKQRALEKRIRGIKYPVVHVAGLKSDPTLPGLFNQYKRLTGNNNHAFYFHKEGIGCGDLFTSKNFVNYITGNRRPHISRFFQSLGRHKAVRSLNQHIVFEEVPVSFNESSFLTSHPSLANLNGSRSLSAFSLNDYSTFAPGKAQFTKKVFINGPVDFNVAIESIGSDVEGRELLLSIDDNISLPVVLSSGLIESGQEQKLKSVMPLLRSFNRGADFKLKLQSKPTTDIMIPLIIGGRALDRLVTIPFRPSGDKPFIKVPVERF